MSLDTKPELDRLAVTKLVQTHGSLEAFLMVAAHVPAILALVYVDMAKAIDKAEQEWNLKLSPISRAMLNSIDKEVLRIAISAAKNAEKTATPRYDGTRGIRPDMPPLAKSKVKPNSDEVTVPLDYADHSEEWLQGYRSSHDWCPYNSPSHQGAAWFAGYYAKKAESK